jgi:hypothetical protein
MRPRANARVLSSGPCGEKQGLSRPSRRGLPDATCCRDDRGPLGLSQSQSEHDLARLSVGQRGPPHPGLTAHDFAPCAVAASTSSSILHMVDVTPAAIAGVQRSVE